MHESERAFENEKQPKFSLLIPRLHFEVWKDRPEAIITDYDYFAEGKVTEELDYNKRRTAWFAAVLGTIELLKFAMEDKDGVDKKDLEEVVGADSSMKNLFERASTILKNKTPEGTEDDLEKLISEGEELLERVYDFAEKYDL